MEISSKKDLARIYYMQGEKQKVIAGKTGVSEKTVSQWVNDGGWDALRAGANITRAELVSKTLRAINSILESYNTSDDPEKTLDADKLCKLAKIVENLDKRTNIVDTIEVFLSFNRWLNARAENDGQLTPELLRVINYYQDLFISESIVKK